ncbi:dimethylamine monooxygenase subunit DmmA family protein [Nocardioides sp.]|uniref:dimethylamine monooxygenase subunit DmmA family protein n=1 Tax=Nocardioides sp. TaxID=35761 RepID=UPI0039E317E5
MAAGWAEAVAPTPADLLTAATAAEVSASVRGAVAAARVGMRAAVAAPAGDALVLRGLLHEAGVEDDEMTVVPVGSGPVRIYCSHCRHTTVAVAAIGAVVPCAGCGLGLHVYYHVSRRSGHFLGFQEDAEKLPGGGGGTQ